MIKIGSKWFKCDLHLHTTASKCFKDRNVTAEDWVTECIEKKLDCVAVTDHNTAEGIAEVQEEAKKKGLYVFPGVEITCDTSKVHMLILFDIDTSYKIIEDFLSACDIDRNKFGQQDAFTTKSIIEVAKKAKERGALIIPAHIDEYNGLGKMGDGPLGMLLDLENINAVQVVHEQFYQNSKLLENPKRIEEVSTYLSKYYPSINSKDRVISKDMIKDWYRPVKKAIEKNLSIVTFSDNPHGERNSSHGTWGIGKRYTWIKMDIQPSLEGLRQAFLMPKFRIKNDFEYKDNPNQKPKMFINSLTLIDTELNRIDEFVIDFHHQLNTIIGTPGSGKSSILKCIRGILKNTKDLEGLDSIFHDHHNFYKVKDKNAKGIFTKNSILKLSINKDNVEYEIVVKEIQDTDRQNVEIYKMENGIREIQPEETLSFFNTEHYSQKQIFEIAQEPNSLRERIDNAIDEMKDKKIVLRSLEGSFLTKCNEIKEIEIKVDRKGFLEAEINDINNQISVFNKSGIQHLLKESKNYETQLLYVTNIENFITDKIKNFDDCINEFKLKNDEVDSAISKEPNMNEVSNLLDNFFINYKNIESKLDDLKEGFTNANLILKENIDKTEWKKGYESNLQYITKEKEKLEEKGVKDFEQFDNLLKTKITKEDELNKIILLEDTLKSYKIEREKIQSQYFLNVSEISTNRSTFLSKVLNGKNIKIKINNFRDRLSFEKKIRNIIDKEEHFDKDIEILLNECFKGKVEDNLQKFRDKVLQIRVEDDTNGYSKKFNKLFSKLEESQINKLLILVPEDEITIAYKQKGSKEFRPLSNASAGQKATAILTFLLSFGEYPLILDQPEDDLNGKLVYDLIVDKLQDAKGRRQVIIVTHDANIPVNADAELITCLSTNSYPIKILLRGTVDTPEIKREICDIMEGSVDAFDMRAKRYGSLRK